MISRVKRFKNNLKALTNSFLALVSLVESLLF